MDVKRWVLQIDVLLTDSLLESTANGFIKVLWPVGGSQYHHIFRLLFAF